MSTTLANTTVSSSVDFEADGVQHGFLKLPYSHDDSAWGCIMTPITVIKNGEGPTALLTGGNHGDEYEGITSLLKLANKLRAEDVQGRVIIVPMMNAPAVQAGTRTSPIDKGNMNRAFPGNPAGTQTERVADYFSRVLIPLCDLALDIHSGGKTLDIVSFAAAHRLPDNPKLEARCIEGAQMFGAKDTVVMLEMEASALYDTAVESQDKVFVTTELGGGGTSTPETLELAERGVDNFLCWARITQGQPQLPDTPTRMLDMPDGDCYLQSEHNGILELCFSLGDQVHAGDTLARIHSIERTGEAAIEYTAKRDGILIARRHLGKVSIGDTIAVLAEQL